MTEAALAVEAVAVALLGRNDACRAQLRQALTELGAEIVHEGDLLGADCTTIAGSRPAVVLINLEADSEDVLDTLDPLLGDPAINVVFNEAESTRQLAGWDLARWARHLAAKVLGHGSTVPPLPAGAEQLPTRDLAPQPGPVPTPAQEIGDVPLDGFAAEAADSVQQVPASVDLTLEAGEAALRHAADSPGSTVAGGAERIGAADAAIDALQDLSLDVAVELDDDAPLEVAVVRDLHEDAVADDAFDLDLDEIEQALVGLDTALTTAARSEVGATRVAADTARPATPEAEGATLDGSDDFDGLDASFDLTFDIDAVASQSTAGAPSPDGLALDVVYDPDAADADLGLDPDVAALAAQLDAQAAGGTGFASGDDGFDLEFDFSAAAASGHREPAHDAVGAIDVDVESFGIEPETASSGFDIGRPAPESGLPSLDFTLPSLDTAPSAELPIVDGAAPTGGSAATVELPIPERFGTAAPPGPMARSADNPSSHAATGSLFAELSLAPIEADDAAPAEATRAATPSNDTAFDFSGLSLSLEPIAGDDDPAGDAATSARAADAVDAVGLDPLGPASCDAATAPGTAAAGPLIPRVIVLGASIGGPDALRTFLSGLPEDFPALFLLAQHLENGFFSRLATQLQKVSKLPIRVADDAAGPLKAGQVVVVPSSHRFRIDEDGAVDAGEHAGVPRYKPCIDDLLHDTAAVFGGRVTAIIFSGMAGDAIEGAVQVARSGGEVWAQDPESCVVSSMVDGARARGVVEFVGSPRELAEQCVRRYGRRG